MFLQRELKLNRVIFFVHICNNSRCSVFNWFCALFNCIITICLLHHIDDDAWFVQPWKVLECKTKYWGPIWLRVLLFLGHGKSCGTALKRVCELGRCVFVAPVYCRLDLCISNWWEVVPDPWVPLWWRAVHAAGEGRHLHGGHCVVPLSVIVVTSWLFFWAVNFFQTVAF